MSRSPLSNVFTVLITALFTAGLGLYLTPRLGECLSLNTIHWGFQAQNTYTPVSPFSEQSLLQNQYETALEEDITTTLEKITGTNTVHAIVRAPLDLIQETKHEPFDTRTDTLKSHVNRLSVTVLIDDLAIPDSNGVSVYHPRSKKELKQYTDTVKSLVGFNIYRGDKVNVQNMSFVAPKGSIGGIPRNIWANGIAFLLFLVLIIAIMVLYLFPIMRLTLLEMKKGLSLHKHPLIGRVITLCHKHPEQSLAVIRGWLNAPQVRKNSRHYTLAEKAGILILSLKKGLASDLIQHLPQEEAQHLAHIISRLGNLNTADIQEVLTRFMRDFYASSYLKGTPQTAQDLFPSYNQNSAKTDARWIKVCSLPDEQIKTLLTYTDKEVMAMALATENTNTRQVFARNMPPLVWKELENRFKIVGEKGHYARQIIIKTAQELDLIR